MVRDLSDENARLKGQDARSIQREMDVLKELLDQRERTIFSESSEKRPRTGDRPSERAAQRDKPAAALRRIRGEAMVGRGIAARMFRRCWAM